jgi:hypothetical protein
MIDEIAKNMVTQFYAFLRTITSSLPLNLRGNITIFKKRYRRNNPTTLKKLLGVTCFVLNKN